jgi:hypothetical protein
MMPGLLEGQEKMSKSDPNSAIFMEDSEADVNTKIKKAYCPPQVGGDSPLCRRGMYCVEFHGGKGGGRGAAAHTRAKAVWFCHSRDAEGLGR